MLRTYEAVLQPDGQLQFSDDMPPDAGRLPRRVLVTFTEELTAKDTALCGARLSEPALAEDWMREEEDEAWAHFKPAGDPAAVSVLRPVGHQAAPGAAAGFV